MKKIYNFLKQLFSDNCPNCGFKMYLYNVHISKDYFYYDIYKCKNCKEEYIYF